jgi:hypothetical protein
MAVQAVLPVVTDLLAAAEDEGGYGYALVCLLG